MGSVEISRTSRIGASMKIQRFILGFVTASLLVSLGAAFTSRAEAQITQAVYFTHTHITTATTTAVKTLPGVVHCVVIGVAGAASSTVKLYNGTVAAGNLVATIDGAATAGQRFCYDSIFGTSINVVTASAGAVPDTVVTWH